MCNTLSTYKYTIITHQTINTHQIWSNIAKNRSNRSKRVSNRSNHPDHLPSHLSNIPPTLIRPSSHTLHHLSPTHIHLATQQHTTYNMQHQLHQHTPLHQHTNIISSQHLLIKYMSNTQISSNMYHTISQLAGLTSYPWQRIIILQIGRVINLHTWRVDIGVRSNMSIYKYVLGVYL